MRSLKKRGSVLETISETEGVDKTSGAHIVQAGLFSGSRKTSVTNQPNENKFEIPEEMSIKAFRKTRERYIVYLGNKLNVVDFLAELDKKIEDKSDTKFPDDEVIKSLQVALIDVVVMYYGVVPKRIKNIFEQKLHSIEEKITVNILQLFSKAGFLSGAIALFEKDPRFIEYKFDRSRLIGQYIKHIASSLELREESRRNSYFPLKIHFDD